MLQVKSQIPPLLYEKPEMYKPKNLHRYKNNDFIDFEQRNLKIKDSHQFLLILESMRIQVSTFHFIK